VCERGIGGEGQKTKGVGDSSKEKEEGWKGGNEYMGMNRWVGGKMKEVGFSSGREQMRG